MNPKLDAGLAERLYKIFWKEHGIIHTLDFNNELAVESKRAWRHIATAVRKIVKEAKEGE